MTKKYEKTQLRTTSFFMSKLIKETLIEHGMEGMHATGGYGEDQFWYHLDKTESGQGIEEDLATPWYHSRIVTEPWELLGQYPAYTAHELMILIPDEIEHKERGWLDVQIRKCPGREKWHCGYADGGAMVKETSDIDYICEALGRVYIYLIRNGYVK